MSDAEEAQGLVERAQALAANGRYGDAVASFDEAIARFGDSDDPAVDSVVGDAMLAKGLTLTQIERDEQAAAVFGQMAERYRQRPDFRGQFSRALVQEATTLNRLDRLDEAVTVYDEVLSTFSDAMEPPLAMGVAFAYLGKAGAQRRLDQLDPALETYDEMVFRFSDSPFPVLRQRVDLALSEKVFVLLMQGRHDEAIVVANAAVERLGQGGESDALAIAVLNLGGALANEQRFDEAITVYDLLIDQLQEAQVQVLRGRRILAISNKVDALMALGDEDEAAALHNEMLERYSVEVPAAFADAAARNQYDEGARAVVAGMMLKQALALNDLGQKQPALAVVSNLLERFDDEQGGDFARVLDVAREFREQLLENDDET